MKKHKILYVCAAAVMVAALLFGCDTTVNGSEEGGGSQGQDSIKLYPSSIVLSKESPAQTLRETIFANNDVISWSVEPKGIIELIGNDDNSWTVQLAEDFEITEDEVTVTATAALTSDQTVTADCTVTVFSNEVELITDLNLIDRIEQHSRPEMIDWAKDGNGHVPLVKANLEKIRNVSSLDLTHYQYYNDEPLTDISVLKYFTGLTSLRLNNNQITEMPDLRQLTKLEEFIFTGNRTSDDELAGLPSDFFSKLPVSITSLDVSANKLTELNVASLTKLTSLNCYNNELKSLGSLPATLTHLICNSNELTDLETLPSGLISLQCADNKLTTIDVSSLPRLTDMDCSMNSELMQLDVSALTNLVWLACYSCGLTELDVSNLPQLETLKCGRLTLTISDSQKELWDEVWSKDLFNEYVVLAGSV